MIFRWQVDTQADVRILDQMEGKMAKAKQDRKPKNEMAQKSKSEEDRQLSKELEMSFPASDAPAATQPLDPRSRVLKRKTK
jgi:hypothetical protein